MKVSGQPFNGGAAVVPSGGGILEIHSSKFIPNVKIEGDLVFSRQMDDRQVAPKFNIYGASTRRELDMALSELKGLRSGVTASTKSQTEAFEGFSPSRMDRFLGKPARVGLFKGLTRFRHP